MTVTAVNDVVDDCGDDAAKRNRHTHHTKAYANVIFFSAEPTSNIFHFALIDSVSAYSTSRKTFFHSFHLNEFNLSLFSDTHRKR